MLVIKAQSKAHEAKQRLIEAYRDAYGRTQAAPDGMYCRMGRIDRAYDVAANESDPGKARKIMAVIEDMQNEATKTFDEADRAMATYRRLCKLEGVTEELIEPDCDCPYCKRAPTFGGKEIS